MIPGMIAAMILLPLAMALLLLTQLRSMVVRGLGIAALPALIFLPAAWQGTTMSVTVLGWTFLLDQPGALLLAASALLWIIGGFAASAWLRQRNGQERFALWWLLTLSGSLGVFVAGDVVSFYALYALASLPAYGLIAFEGGEQDRRAGRITLAAALIGEALILAAFVLLVAAAAEHSLSIDAVMVSLPQSPQCALIIALVVIGFGLKIGLVPLHGWMPLSYGAGPLVATAVLSGATSKAGLIGLIRFLPLDGAMPVAGGLILVAGLFSAFYGAFIGLTQTNPRSVLAYSSVSQLGQMAAVLGAGLAAGVPGAGTLVAFYAVYHVLTKGGLFLLLGSRLTARWQMWFAGFLALGFAGLPLTGGALGKLAFKDVTGSGLTGTMFALAAVGSTVLMLHFLRCVRAASHEQRQPAVAWLATGIAATVLPWSLLAGATGMTTSSALTSGVIIELGWPVAAGLMVAWLLSASGARLPHLEEGDVSARAIAAIERLAPRLADRLTRFETRAHQWPVSTLALAVALIAFVALQAWFGPR